jgi:hypothetical protein
VVFAQGAFVGMRSALYTAPIAVAMVSFFIGRCVFRAYFYALNHLTWII